MKKFSVLKRMTALFVMAVMLLVIIPVSAATAENVPTGSAWETLSTIDMSMYTSNSSDGQQCDGWWGSGTVDGRTSYLAAFPYSNYYTSISSVNRIHHNTGLLDVTSGWGFPTDFKNGGTKLFDLKRGWSNTGYLGAGIGKPNSGIMVTNLFDESDVAVGDTIRVSAWVNGKNVMTTADPDAASEDKNYSISMWVSESNMSDKNWQTGTDVNYSASEPDSTKPDEVVYTTATESEWKKVVLTYTITEANKTISSIQLNTDNATHDVTTYPWDFALAGIKVEKIITDVEEIAGVAKGTINVFLDDIPEGSDNQILVAAYDGNLFLNCDLIPYSSAESFEFSIPGAAQADNVRAYLWEMNSLAPYIIPIDCEFVAQ